MFRILFAATAVACACLPAFAEPVLTVEDAYARSASDKAKSGASFMMIRNTGTTDDRLIAAKTDVAARVELHTHKENADGLMMMLEVEEGFAVPAGGMAMLERGGNHVMLMGLTQPLKNGDSFPLTLVFETAGEITFDIVVDRERAPKAGHGHGHSNHGAHKHDH